MEEDLTPEDIPKPEEAPEEEETGEEEEYIPRPRRGRPPRRRAGAEIPKEVEEAFKKIDGATALKLMQFLHSSYLSWINEAEATKYYNVSREAWNEAMQMQQQMIKQLVDAFANQLQSTLSPTLETVNKALATIEERVRAIEKTTSKPMIDERMIALGAILLKGFKDKLGLPSELSDLLDAIIYSSARDYLKRTAGGQGDTGKTMQEGGSTSE
jgi:hypothetical protein